MDRELVKKLLAVWDAAKVDEPYQELVEEYPNLDKKVQSAMEKMAPEHREAVMDYLGLIHAINLQTVIIALTLGEKC